MWQFFHNCPIWGDVIDRRPLSTNAEYRGATVFPSKPQDNVKKWRSKRLVANSRQKLVFVLEFFFNKINILFLKCLAELERGVRVPEAGLSQGWWQVSKIMLNAFFNYNSVKMSRELRVCNQPFKIRHLKVEKNEY